MSKYGFKVVMSLLVFTLFLTACGSNASSPSPTGSTSASPSVSAQTSTSTSPSPSTSASPVAAEETTFRGWTTNITTRNPHMDFPSVRSYLNLGQLATLLASKDGSEELVIEPYHAKELPKSSDGGTTWKVELRDGLEWMDGTPINAHTYEYSAKMQLDPKLVNQTSSNLFTTVIIKNAKKYFQGECEWEEVGIKAVDDKTLEFVLEYPATELDFYTHAMRVLFPVHQEMYEKFMNEDKTSTTYGTTLESTPSCGMFELMEWVPDSHDLSKRNDKDPIVKAGYIHVDYYHYTFTSSGDTRSKLFFNNEIDTHALSGPEYNTYKNDPRGVKLYASSIWGVFVNGASANKAMGNKDLRQALNLAAPREECATEVYVLYTPASYYIAGAIFVGDPLTGGQTYRSLPRAQEIADKFKTDHAKALELFNKAYADLGNKKITVEFIYFDQQEQMKRTAEVAQEVYENLFGSDRFELKIRAVLPQAAYDLYRAGEYDMGVGVRIANIFNPWSSMNVWRSDYGDKYITGFDNKTYDDLQFSCEFGDLSNNLEGKTQALMDMEEMILDYGAFIPLFQNDNTHMYHEWVNLPTYNYISEVGVSNKQSEIMPH